MFYSFNFHQTITDRLNYYKMSVCLILSDLESQYDYKQILACKGMSNFHSRNVQKAFITV